jgi:hypothetical protein
VYSFWQEKNTLLSAVAEEGLYANGSKWVFMLGLFYHSASPFSNQWIKGWMGPTVSLLIMRSKENYSCPDQTNSVILIAAET